MSERSDEVRTLANVRWTRIRLFVALGATCALMLLSWSLTIFGLHTMNGLRGFVEAEALYSKDERDAVQRLTRFAYSGDEALYSEFRRHIAVLAGVERARLELLKQEPDLEAVHRGLGDLGIDARDFGDMVNLFRRFQGFERVQRAIKDWGEGDRLIGELRAVGETLHKRLQEQNTAARSQQHHIAYSERINALTISLDRAERDFSHSLGRAARWDLSLLLYVVTGFAVFAIAVLSALTVAAARHLRRAQAVNAALEQRAWVRASVARHLADGK